MMNENNYTSHSLLSSEGTWRTLNMGDKQRGADVVVFRRPACPAGPDPIFSV